LYIGNGVTKEFPLPDGADGSVAFWLPPDGKAIRMKEGYSYTVRDGTTVVFSAPPPDGWRVVFEEESGTPGNWTPGTPSPGQAGLKALVIYPDGTVREICEDPFELLVKSQGERHEIKRLLLEARREREAACKQISAAAEEAKEALKSRLLNYDARAEAAIAAAVKASEEETATIINKRILEIRNRHKETLNARSEVETMMRRVDALIAEAAEALDKRGGEIARGYAADFDAKMREVHGAAADIRKSADRCEQMAAATEAIRREMKMAGERLNKERKALHEQILARGRGANNA